MATNILMPALSPTMEKGNLAKWLKKEGDTIKAGDVIAEIETDKATMEVEAADEGVLAKIVVPEGTADVPVNQVIAVLAGEGEDVKQAAAGAAKAVPTPSPAPAQAAAPSPPPSPQRGEGAGRAASSAQPSSETRQQGTAAPQAVSASSRQRGEGAPAPARTNGGGRIFASPLARRLAKEAGIEIARVQGSGPHGRIIARDIAAAKEGKGLAPAAPAAAAAAAPMIPAPSDDKIRALFEAG